MAMTNTILMFTYDNYAMWLNYRTCRAYYHKDVDRKLVCPLNISVCICTVPPDANMFGQHDSLKPPGFWQYPILPGEGGRWYPILHLPDQRSWPSGIWKISTRRVFKIWENCALSHVPGRIKVNSQNPAAFLVFQMVLFGTNAFVRARQTKMLS